MIRVLLNVLKCPLCVKTEELFFKKNIGNKNLNGIFFCKHNHKFNCQNSIVDFIEKDNKEQKIYNEIWKLQKKSIFKNNLKKIENKFNEYAQLPKNLEYYFKNKIVLDAGSGVGRFSYLIKKFSPKLLFSVDFSKEATVQTQRNLMPLNNNIIIIRADLNNLPFRKNKFDFIFSFGVIHHNLSPSKTFDKLVNLIKENGLISIYIYKKNSLSFLQNLIRPITLKIDRKKIKSFCKSFGFASSKNVIINIKKIFIFLGKYDILGIRNISYEGLTTTYLRSYSLSEIEMWFKKNYLKIISKTNIISVTGKK
jgi:SAM-dependent methyltransferase